MLSYYCETVDRFASLSSDAKQTLRKAGEMLIRDHAPELRNLLDAYPGCRYKITGLKDSCQALSASLNLPRETLSFVVIVCAAKPLREEYRTLGFSDVVFDDTMEDLACKVNECHTVCGCYGIMDDAANWYALLFQKSLFKLGRLEYETGITRWDISLPQAGITASAGNAFLKLHIPSAGPLTRDARIDSYRRAYEQFPQYRRNGVLPILCHSWLLYPKNLEFFPEHLNVTDFLRDFDLIGAEEDPDFHDCWRVFGKFYDGHPETLPRDTSLQRAIADWLIAGHPCGIGLGLILFDGERLRSGTRA